jgi:hypothetical protein
MEKETKITKSVAGLIELRDDDTETGGVSFRGETLADFIEETDLGYGRSLDEVNKALKECGIMPITERDIPDYYDILLDMVLEKGGYILIPLEDRLEVSLRIVDDDDDNKDYRKTLIKSIVHVCEYECMCLGKLERGCWLKVIDTNDEMWDVDDYMLDEDIELLCEIVESLN